METIFLKLFEAFPSVKESPFFILALVALYLLWKIWEHAQKNGGIILKIELHDESAEVIGHQIGKHVASSATKEAEGITTHTPAPPQ